MPPLHSTGQVRAVLVTTDAFRVGGRETFLVTHISEMVAREDCRAALLSAHVSGRFPGGLFDPVHEVSGSSLSEIRCWIDSGSKLLNEFDASLVWSHHYRLLPAWLLSALFNRPMLPTFHGPLTSVGKPGSAIEALGMTLAIHRIPLLTAVSDEIASTLREVRQSGLDVRLLPNRVRTAKAASRRRRGGTRMLMMMRSEKLQHLRSGVELAGRWRRLIGPVELIVHSSFRGDEQPSAGLWFHQLFSASRILGRRWLAQGLDRVTGALVTRFEPPTEEPQAQVARADVVLGMGRALLEGLAAGLPSVLVGYDRVVGLVTNDNFADLRVSNFSGRGSTPQPLSVVIKDTAEALSQQRVLDPKLIEEVDISAGWKRVWPLMVEATSVNTPVSEDRLLAERLVRLLNETANEEKFVMGALSLLHPNERATFNRLISGQS
jgi:hypothetical protein